MGTVAILAQGLGHCCREGAEEMSITSDNQARMQYRKVPCRFSRSAKNEPDLDGTLQFAKKLGQGAKNAIFEARLEEVGLGEASIDMGVVRIEKAAWPDAFFRKFKSWEGDSERENHHLRAVQMCETADLATVPKVRLNIWGYVDLRNYGGRQHMFSFGEKVEGEWDDVYPKD